MPERKSRHPRPSPQRVAATRKQHVQLLVVLVLMAFASALGGGFVWSDREDLLQGAHRIDSSADVGAMLTHSRDAFRSLTLGGSAAADAGSWQPLVVLSNSVSWALWGDCAFCFRLENVLLHALLVIGLYALGRHLLSHRRHGNRVAAWAAALYAVHPATVSSVAWIGGRPTLLAAAFSVWTLVIFTRLPATTKSRPGHVRRWLIALGAVSACAMLAHEQAFMLPLLALLVATFEAMERDRHPFGGISPRRWKGLAVLLGTLLAVLLYRRLALGGVGFAAEYPAASLLDNAGTALRHFWFLIQEALLPGEPILSDAWRITDFWTAAEVASLLGVLVLMTAIVVGLRLRHPAALGGAWLVLWLLPGVGVFPADRYHDSQVLYLAVWGVAFALGFVILQLWRPVGRQLVPGSEGLAFAPIIIVLAVITAFSNVRWWEHRGLFDSEIASDPHYIEGRVELAKEALAGGDAAVALNHLLTAVEASKDTTYTGYWPQREAQLLLGRASWQVGNYDAAADTLGAALQANPDDPDLLYWLAVTALSRQSHAAAEQHLREARQLRSPFPDADADLGVALAGQQRFVEAYPLLAAAIDAGLGNARRHRALALVYIDGNRLDDAARHLETALASRDSAIERARLAWVYWRLGRAADAKDALRAATDMADGDAYVDWVRTQLEPDAQTADRTAD